jgi:hypothetical protein
MHANIREVTMKQTHMEAWRRTSILSLVSSAIKKDTRQEDV